MTLNKRLRGNLGEGIACLFLEKRGFRVVCRNYQKAWGEIDIIAVKDDVWHFFEVKSVTYWDANDSHGHKPEENVHALKTRHIGRMIETFLFDQNMGHDVDFRFHVVCVFMNMHTRKARVKLIENVVIGV